MVTRRCGISLRCADSWDIELNTRREIPYPQATMYYFVYYINVLLTRRSSLYSCFKKKTRWHWFIVLNRASDKSAAYCWERSKRAATLFSKILGEHAHQRTERTLCRPMLFEAKRKCCGLASWLAMDDYPSAILAHFRMAVVVCTTFIREL